MGDLKFSLIVCTLGRDDFIEQFLLSLENQTYKNYEVIVVDQNKDDRIDHVVSKYINKFPIKHIKTTPGLSKARNEGIRYVKGDIIAFPDDDCIYTVDMLEKINEFMNLNEQCDVLSIKMTNSIKNGRKVQENFKSQNVKKENIMKLVASISMFMRRNVVEHVGYFDENLGLGAKTVFQGAEDYDYPCRCIDQGYNIYYLNSIEVLHPWDDDEIDKSKNLEKRSFSGGAAEMYFLNKNKYSMKFKLNRLIRRVAVAIYYCLKLDWCRAKQSIYIMKGMIKYFNVKI